MPDDMTKKMQGLFSIAQSFYADIERMPFEERTVIVNFINNMAEYQCEKEEAELEDRDDEEDGEGWKKNQKGVR